MHTDLSPYAVRSPDGELVDLLDDHTALTPHSRLDAYAPHPADAAVLVDDQGHRPADHDLTGDTRDWRRVMAGVRARLAADVADLERYGPPDMGPDSPGCASAQADIAALAAPIPHGTLRAVRSA